MLSLLWFALMGLAIGSLAKFIMPGKDPGGFIITILLGVGGSFLGSFVSSLVPFFETEFGEFGLVGIIFSVIGAILLLLIYRMMNKK